MQIINRLIHKSRISLMKQSVFVTVFFFVWSLRLAWIGLYGVDVPFWDQWDAELQSLYFPILNGDFDPSILIAQHAEHRIFFTRFLNIIIFLLNGSLNNILIMQIQAILPSIIAGFFAQLLWNLNKSTLVSAGIALCFAAPLGTENMFWAFCSQFYFMILFSVLSLYFIFVKGNDQRYFHYSLLFSVFAFLSLASGALVSFVIFLISLFQIVFNIGKSKKRTYFTSIIFFCLFLFEIFSTTLPTKHERLHGSASSLLKVINLFLGWPLIDGMPFGFIIHIVNIFLIFFILFRKRDKLKDTNFQFFISLLFWINAQILLFAYARGNSNLPNRYLDIFFLLPIFSFFLFQSILENKNTLRLINIIFFLISLYFFHSIIHSGYLSRVRLSIERENMLTIVTTSRKKELREKNSSLEYLQKLPETALPYPDAVRLHHIIADPLFDKLMPFLFFRDKN